MISVTSIVIISCALALGVQGQNVCSEAQYQYIPTNHPVKLLPVYMDPFVADYNVSIPPIPECVKGVSGLHAIVCDNDQPPNTTFVNWNTLIVHRTGSLAGKGVVYITAYCIE
ncbi:hypothetical protein B5X24_HaOG215593 [Helicoverpa armigera]|uniref:Uncharacterized protein n=1 Tax=Helicoverpa armigera TaxID=29058 RepID=A0A2W1B531_HELAM|nr:hypothetical protein B5X24_HaOG215593 [Helicoverpa armigera]